MYCYNYTWAEILGRSQSDKRDVAIVSSEGYLILSRDRKLDERPARQLYLSSLEWAILKGKPVPAAVLEENAGLVAKLRAAHPDLQIRTPSLSEPAATVPEGGEESEQPAEEALMAF
ncbi:MAG: hypothetical protein WDA72_01320 [Desulfomonilia bacterium]